jgi:nucleotide-binding universal stress UspA family protein
MMPFGREINLHVVNVYSKDTAESELILSLMAKFLDAHGIEPTTASIKSKNAHDAILDYAHNVDADLLVAGAHSVSGIRRIAFGSITEKLLANCPLPMFLNQ